MVATISADIVDSTTLASEGMVRLRNAIKEVFEKMEKISPVSWGRLTRGDFIECVIPTPTDSLRIALLLKTKLKSLNLKKDLSPNSLFSTYGARIAIGIGHLKTIDRENDIMEGEAIYLSGRKLDEKEPCSKGTLSLCVSNPSDYLALNSVCVLADALVNKMTMKQANVIFYKLLNMKVEDIAKTIGITQATVSQHSTQACWYAIENALKTFESEKIQEP